MSNWPGQSHELTLNAVTATARQMEALVSALYGLAPAEFQQVKGAA
jgi:hypothetical protein